MPLLQLAAAMLLLLLPGSLRAADVKLYLKEGGHHVVREYEVKSDRVRFYSAEREDWEEIPLDLVDLKKTEAEVQRRQGQASKQAEADRAEREAERAQRREIARVPEEAGVYWIDGSNLIALKTTETKVVNNKRRNVLKALSPIPIVAGKATLEADGLQAAQTIRQSRPEFYLRISQPERFTIVRCAANKEKTARVIERWSIVPVTKELIQEHDEVELFRHQVGEDLYKIWPQKDMPAGEYAFIQYTDGKGNVQVWDFSIGGGGGSTGSTRP